MRTVALLILLIATPAAADTIFDTQLRVVTAESAAFCVDLGEWVIDNDMAVAPDFSDWASAIHAHVDVVGASVDTDATQSSEIESTHVSGVGTAGSQLIARDSRLPTMSIAASGFRVRFTLLHGGRLVVLADLLVDLPPDPPGTGLNDSFVRLIDYETVDLVYERVLAEDGSLAVDDTIVLAAGHYELILECHTEATDELFGAIAHVTTSFEFEATVDAYRSPDIDGDGDVDVADLLHLLGDWGACPPPPRECAADLDADGEVGVPDLLALLLAWG